MEGLVLYRTGCVVFDCVSNEIPNTNIKQFTNALSRQGRCNDVGVLVLQQFFISYVIILSMPNKIVNGFHLRQKDID